MAMIGDLKHRLYFLVARYFRFWAGFRLRRWKPTIILVTGSSGKTTLLHLLEAQLGKKARYSYHANSAIGIPFDILNLHRTKLTPDEWLGLFLSAPFKAFAVPPAERIYVAEADCDRPAEGKFLGNFLQPDITVWLSLGRTHSMNFDRLVAARRFPTMEDAIANEFGHYIEYARKTVIINADNPYIMKQIPRTKATVRKLKKTDILKHYQPGLSKTVFKLRSRTVTVPALVPEATWYAVAASLHVLETLKRNGDMSFTGFRLPPGRSGVFTGKKGITIVDSSYNANLESTAAVLSMFAELSAREKWLVISDMLELGASEKSEHEALARAIARVRADRIILMGPRITRYTLPVLKDLISDTPLIAFQKPTEVLEYLQKNLVGRETILFKGGRFLEGIIEHLLLNPEDAANLCRREKIWQMRRRKWGL